jgi:outer membrane immunogenic protein
MVLDRLPWLGHRRHYRMEGFVMRTKLWGGISVLASIAASVGAANAADLAVKAPVYKAPPVYVSDWAGFYLGVAGGYGFGSTSFDPNFASFGDNAKPKGGLVGGYVGYNWQFGSWVTGLEVDFSGADLKATSVDFNQKTDELGSARARLGYTVLPNLLAYGTAGAGWGHTTLTALPNTPAPGVSDSVTQFGWVAGAGLEYKVWGNFIARAEYLHYDFGKQGFNFPNTSVLPNMSETVDIVRGGVSYKF